MAGRAKTKKNSGVVPRVTREGRKVIRAPGNQGTRPTALDSRTDSPVALLKDIQAARLDPRDLTAKQRRACLLLIANGSRTSTELADLFKVSPSCVRKDMRIIRGELGREVREWGLDEVLGQLLHSAERYQAKAMEQEDVALAWTIQRDTVKLLKELGVVGQEEKRDGLRITVEALGEGYERAAGILSGTLGGVPLSQDLMGVVPDEPRDLEATFEPRPLALETRPPREPMEGTPQE